MTLGGTCISCDGAVCTNSAVVASVSTELRELGRLRWSTVSDHALVVENTRERLSGVVTSAPRCFSATCREQITERTRAEVEAGCSRKAAQAAVRA